MLKLFAKKNKRIKIEANNIFINNEKDNVGVSTEITPVFEFKEEIPQINVFENNKLSKTFTVETLKANPNLIGQFLHTSIRIQPNSGVMIDGVISNSRKTHPQWKDEVYEAIRLQPFYLSDADNYNLQLIGRGLFERGLHFSGTVTPATVRNICICDNCNKSFTIQHFHAGFSEVQYFYSSDSKETLLVPYGVLENLPRQLQEDIKNETLEYIERELPLPSKS